MINPAFLSEVADELRANYAQITRKLRAKGRRWFSAP